MTKISSPFSPFMKDKECCILDGGLASELELMGHDLRHPLWSAKLLLLDQDAILKVHLSYLESGADCIISASYQLSYAGGQQLGLSEEKVTRLLLKSVQIAVDARNKYLSKCEYTGILRPQPVIAASIGPFGAFLCDGSEYDGVYGKKATELNDFHEKRMDVLNNTDADILACETIPSFQEAKVLDKLLSREGMKPSYVSFSCRDGVHISDGTPIATCVQLLNNNPNIVAVGINCTEPQYVLSLIQEIRKESDDLHIIVYPNSGEQYDPLTRSWKGDGTSIDFAEMAKNWHDAGANILGGCCRTGPGHIRQIKELFVLTRKSIPDQ